MNKTILVRDWTKMPVHAEATMEHGKQKLAEDGSVWEWISGGKRVTAKRISK